MVPQEIKYFSTPNNKNKKSLKLNSRIIKQLNPMNRGFTID